MDLENFFGTINFGRVRGYFLKDKNFELDPKIATWISQLVCYNNQLPQGSPCSPVVSNLVGHILDVRLVRLAKLNKVFYTRYADDITFSTNLLKFPRKVAYQDPKDSGKWVLANTLTEEIRRAGFQINSNKTRMQIAGSRQETTGLVVNSKVNISQKKYRQVRSMCHRLFQEGEFFIKVGDQLERQTDLRILEGQLGHIRYVRGRFDLPEEIRKELGYTTPEGIAKLYARLLFYKFFVAPEIPIIVTEGKTDISYLKSAIKNLFSDYPQLARKDDNKIKLNVSFVNPTSTVTEFLKIGISSSHLIPFLKKFKRNRLRYHPPKNPMPIILLVDNDSGFRSIEKTLIANYGLDKSFKYNAVKDWERMHENLYLLKTPIVGEKLHTRMEDLFSDRIKMLKLGNKNFDPDKKHGDETTFTKHMFAEYVVKRRSRSSDFPGFHKLLASINEIIADYQSIRLDSRKSVTAPSQSPSSRL